MGVCETGSSFECVFLMRARRRRETWKRFEDEHRQKKTSIAAGGKASGRREREKEGDERRGESLKTSTGSDEIATGMYRRTAASLCFFYSPAARRSRRGSATPAIDRGCVGSRRGRRRGRRRRPVLLLSSRETTEVGLEIGRRGDEKRDDGSRPGARCRGARQTRLRGEWAEEARKRG